MEEIKKVLDELREIKIDIKIIKESMPKKDMFLTAEEKELLEESFANEQRGELISGQALRKELGI